MCHWGEVRAGVRARGARPQKEGVGRGGQAGRHRDHPGHLHLLHRWPSINFCPNLCTAQFRARSPTSWSTKPSSSWRTRATLRTTHPWSSWCLHHGPAPRFLHFSISVLFCLFVPNYIIALYLPLSTVSTQPCLTYLQVRAGARALMAEVGQGPVSLSREVPGFVLNRMQVERAFDKD